MNKEPKTVLYDSPEAASVQTVTGWVDRHGRFWGNDEHMARWCGATHEKCPKCGAVKGMRSYCEPCHKAAETEKWLAMPREPWDGVAMLYSEAHDRYFSDIEEVADYCNDSESNVEALRLIICKPNMARPIEPEDHFIDDLPEDGELPVALQEAFAALNDAILACKEPLSWSPGKTAPTPESVSIE